MDFPSFLGLVGVVIIGGAYFLVQSQRISANTVIYPLANVLGSGLILVSLIFDWNTPSFCIELIWMLISFFGVIKNLQKRPKVLPVEDNLVQRSL
ncbi:MAG: hypothetical protein U1E78_00720 [Gammaproteobacteria bacterium]